MYVTYSELLQLLTLLADFGMLIVAIVALIQNNQNKKK
ncbi:MAG: putative holin-like toxin [Eubacteriales bacterium]|nr:putative holin-like toxin [Eubacteriales bacterium]MDO5783989.1 putative holin-like toxin [Eubacteriales bacterium]